MLQQPVVLMLLQGAILLNVLLTIQKDHQTSSQIIAQPQWCRRIVSSSSCGLSSKPSIVSLSVLFHYDGFGTTNRFCPQQPMRCVENLRPSTRPMTTILFHRSMIQLVDVVPAQVVLSQMHKDSSPLSPDSLFFLFVFANKPPAVDRSTTIVVFLKSVYLNPNFLRPITTMHQLLRRYLQFVCRIFQYVFWDPLFLALFVAP